MSKRTHPVITKVQFRALARFTENDQNEVIDIPFGRYFRMECMNTWRSLIKKQFIVMDLEDGLFKITRSGLVVYLKFKDKFNEL